MFRKCRCTTWCVPVVSHPLTHIHTNRRLCLLKHTLAIWHFGTFYLCSGNRFYLLPLKAQLRAMTQISQCDLLSQRSREKERIVNRQFGLTSGGFEKKNFSIWLVCSIMLLPIVWQSCCTHTLYITFVFNNWKRLPFLRADFCRLVVALFCFSLQFQSPELILIRVLFFSCSHCKVCVLGDFDLHHEFQINCNSLNETKKSTHKQKQFTTILSMLFIVWRKKDYSSALACLLSFCIYIYIVCRVVCIFSFNFERQKLFL